jgi:hypothetical protein
MSNDPLGRRILPQQTSQMGTFSFAPQAYQQPRETQKSAHTCLALQSSLAITALVLTCYS